MAGEKCAAAWLREGEEVILFMANTASTYILETELDSNLGRPAATFCSCLIFIFFFPPILYKCENLFISPTGFPLYIWYFIF